jgi:hypothetical protein
MHFDGILLRDVEHLVNVIIGRQQSGYHARGVAIDPGDLQLGVAFLRAVVAAAKDGVPSVPRGPFAAGGTSQPVFVVDGGRLVRRQVRFGVMGFDRLEIADGVELGTEIVLSDMQDYAHLETVRLR